VTDNNTLLSTISVLWRCSVIQLPAVLLTAYFTVCLILPVQFLAFGAP